MIQATKTRKILIYISSALSYFIFFGFLGVISRLKKPMSEELHLSTTYLGIVDGMKFIARSLGFFTFLFYPPKYPKRDFLRASLAIALLFNAIAATALIPQFSEPIIIIGMFFVGFCSAVNLFPLFIVNQYFDSRGEDKKKIAIWIAFGSLGTAFSVLFCEVLLQNLKVSWSLCYVFFTIIFLIPTVSLSLLSEEISMGNNQEENNENISVFGRFKQFIRSYYYKPSNIFHTLQHAWNCQISLSIQLWFPYYFLSLGYNFQASLMLVAYSVSFCLSSPLFECLINPFEAHLQIILIAMFILNAGTILAMTQLQEAFSSFPLYLGLAILSAFWLSGPRSRIFSQELKNRANRGNKELLMIILAVGCASQLGVGIDTIIIGIVMQIRLKNFLYVLLALSILAAANQIFRQLSWGQDYQQIQKQEQQNKQSLSLEE